jgi:hypothetical protein
MPYRLGRLPEDLSRPRLTLAPHLRAVAPPAAVNWYGPVRSWGVLANDLWGCCVFAGNGHIVEQQTALGGHDETIVTDTETLDEYSRVTGFNPAAGPPGDNPTDQGATVQDGLADLQKIGLAGQKIAAYARVNQADDTELRIALAELGVVSLGLNFPQSAMDQFDAGEPWTVVADDGGILGGHCVPAVGYDAGYVYVVSWGRVVPVAWGWLAAYCEEAWAVVSQMWAGLGGKDPEGVDLHSLGAEFAVLTGQGNPFPAPAPPPPPPVPEPPVPPSVAAELAAVVRQAIAAIEAFLTSHGL